MRSAGLGAWVPEARKLQVVPLIRWIACRASHLPTRTSESPGDFRHRRMVWALGLRRSPSMRRTLPSNAASVAARFTEVRVLPSPGAVEVTISTRGERSGQE